MSAHIFLLNPKVLNILKDLLNTALSFADIVPLNPQVTSPCSADILGIQSETIYHPNMPKREQSLSHLIVFIVYINVGSSWNMRGFEFKSCSSSPAVN